MICPRCRAEYREDIAVCATDGETLVGSLPEETGKSFAALEQALEDGSATLSAPRTLEDAQRDQELLHEAGVPCLLYANPDSQGPGGAAKLYHLALLAEHLEAATAALDRRRAAMLAAEGMAVSDRTVDLTAAEVECPACGFKFGRVDTCPDCGLFLGKEATAP